MQLQAAQSTSRVSWPKILFGLSPREKILDFKGHTRYRGMRRAGTSRRFGKRRCEIF